MRTFTLLLSTKYNILLFIFCCLCLLKVEDFRRGYSVSNRLVKLTRSQDFPSQLPGYQDLPPLLFVLSYQL